MSIVKNINLFAIVILFALISCGEAEQKRLSNSKALKSAETSTYHDGLKRLQHAYPDFIEKTTANAIVFKDKSSMIYDDGVETKNWEQLLNSPSLKDQFTIVYKKGQLAHLPKKYEDPGRIRNEAFFKKMYGSTENEVQKNLVEIDWLPNSAPQKIKVTQINKINEKFTAISNELDKLPALTKYVSNIGGTFTWRYIKGTKRLSEHSFGIAIDINTTFSNYWMWDCKCSDEQQTIGYSNRIPFEIVAIFEKYGFIWGGKWYHYDTMHFEYRPELLN